MNGRLFEEPLKLAAFDSDMRSALLDCSSVGWGAVSPAIFGALFQSIMDEKARRNLGAHYTSEENILKLIKPLFLDDLWAEFQRVKGNRNRLFEFHKKLRSLTFLDPACGCGNFLVITYRELRKLEREVLRVSAGGGQQFVDVFGLVQVDVDQFHGIEIEEFPVQIAQVAMWLVDHQMNQKVSEEFGMYFARIPLKSSPHIVHGNALRLDWNDVVPAARVSYIMGNPPFIGHHYQSADQKRDQRAVMNAIPACGVLDYVANWYVKVVEFMKQNGSIEAAFVSTNSIIQGEQVGILWAYLLSKDVSIQFAHRTFAWTNEARGVAAVHCVIVGFGLVRRARRRLFDYPDPDGPSVEMEVKNINPYLVDGPDVVVLNRTTPICNVPSMRWGNKPTDGGHLIFSRAEADQFVALEPNAKKYVRPYISGGDFIDGVERRCLWLQGALPEELQSMPLVLERLSEVRRFRLASRAETTRAYAKYPSLFRQIAQPQNDYLAIPEVSSERRAYLPMAMISKDVICSNKIQFVAGATQFQFGVLTSAMHMAWLRHTCGRLESRISYSSTIVYNNFPWPDQPSDKQVGAIEAAAQGVLDARAQFPGSSLADLYDPLTMPPELLGAHQKLDRAVDAAYGRTSFASEAERVAFLFTLYQRYTSLLPDSVVAAGTVTKKRAKKSAKTSAQKPAARANSPGKK